MELLIGSMYNVCTTVQNELLKLRIIAQPSPLNKNNEVAAGIRSAAQAILPGTRTLSIQYHTYDIII